MNNTTETVEFEERILSKIEESLGVRVIAQRTLFGGVYDAGIHLNDKKVAIEIKSGIVDMNRVQAVAGSLAVSPQETLILIAEKATKGARSKADDMGFILITTNQINDIPEIVETHEKRIQLKAILNALRREDLIWLAKELGVPPKGKRKPIVSDILERQPDIEDILSKMDQRKQSNHIVYIKKQRRYSRPIETLDSHREILNVDYHTRRNEVIRINMLSPLSSYKVAQIVKNEFMEEVELSDYILPRLSSIVAAFDQSDRYPIHISGLLGPRRRGGISVKITYPDALSQLDSIYARLFMEELRIRTVRFKTEGIEIRLRFYPLMVISTDLRMFPTRVFDSFVQEFEHDILEE